MSAIRKITSAGVVTTLAGTAGVFGNADGTGGATKFIFLCFDDIDAHFVADTFNTQFVKLLPLGGLALPAQLEVLERRHRQRCGSVVPTASQPDMAQSTSRTRLTW